MPKRWLRWLIGESIRFRWRSACLNSSACGNNGLQGSPDCKAKVLVGDDGTYYFIDTIIFKSDADGLDTYKKYSPNYSKSRTQGE